MFLACVNGEIEHNHDFKKFKKKIHIPFFYIYKETKAYNLYIKKYYIKYILLNFLK